MAPGDAVEGGAGWGHPGQGRRLGSGRDKLKDTISKAFKKVQAQALQILTPGVQTEHACFCSNKK